MVAYTKSQQRKGVIFHAVFLGFASILTSVSESLKTLAQEESPAPSEAGTGISMASPVYDRRQVGIT